MKIEIEANGEESTEVEKLVDLLKNMGFVSEVSSIKTVPENEVDYIFGPPYRTKRILTHTLKKEQL